MKAFLLAAGLGTRLRPLTDSTPKCLLPIRGTPLLEIWLGLCRQHGIDDVLINTHFHGGQVKNYLAAHRDGVRTTVVDESTLLGSAGTIVANRRWVAAESSFWIFYADVLTNANLTRIVQFHQTHQGVATLGGYEVPDPERCGIMEAGPDGRIDSFVEKPESPRGRLAFSGILLANPGIFDAIPQTIPADLGFDVFPQLAGRMFAHPISDYLLDIGTIGNYELAQSSWPGLI